jgi:hypothetical protein
MSGFHRRTHHFRGDVAAQLGQPHCFVERQQTVGAGVREIGNPEIDAADRQLVHDWFFFGESRHDHSIGGRSPRDQALSQRMVNRAGSIFAGIRTGEGSRMISKPPRENVRPLEEILDLVEHILGAAVPDRIVAWLGVSKRNAERWISGDSTWPPSLVEKLGRVAPECDRLDGELTALVERFRSDDLSENLIRVRIREFSKRLSDEPPPRPMPPEPQRD